MQLNRALATVAMAAMLTTGAAFAQEHRDNNQYVKHDEWRKGARINHEDWDRGDKVDWHAHHLKTPPRGYEWRQVDGNYVLAAAATGIIAASIIAAGH